MNPHPSAPRPGRRGFFITGTCPGAFRFLAYLPFLASYPELRFQPRAFVKELFKLPHPEGPLVHPIPMSLENPPGLSSSAELLQLQNLNCRAKHCLTLQLCDMPSSCLPVGLDNLK